MSNRFENKYILLSQQHGNGIYLTVNVQKYVTEKKASPRLTTGMSKLTSQNQNRLSTSNLQSNWQVVQELTFSLSFNVLIFSAAFFSCVKDNWKVYVTRVDSTGFSHVSTTSALQQH